MARARGATLLVLAAAILVAVGAGLVANRHRTHDAGLTSSGATGTTGRTVTSVSSVSPQQLLTGDAASFAGSDGGWFGAAPAVTHPATTARSGSGSLAITAPAGGAMVAWSPPQPAKPGARYVGTAWLRAVTAARSGRAELRFLDSAGAVTDTEDVAQPATDSTTGWTQLPPVAAIAPQGTARVELGIAFPVVGAGADHLADDATLEQTPGGSSPVVPPLTVRGNRILQGDGQPLILRGLQRFGLEGGTQTPMPTNAEIGQLKRWGANEVRISLGEQKWLASNCHYDPGYQQQVDQIVHWVTSRGMVALLNLHFATLTDCGPPGLTPMADSPGAVTFWQEVATRYRDNPLVAFDLFNEPTVPASVWLDGGTFVQSKLSVRAAGMQQLYDTVRSTGATNLVVVSGLDYADHPPPRTVAGYGIAYGAHAYQCSSAPPPSCRTPHPYDASVPLRHWLGFSASYPVVVTEFGWPNGDDGRYNANVIGYAEQHGWGWSGFAWDGGTDGTFDLVQAHPASDGTTVEPNAGGMPLLAGFARNTRSHQP